MLSSLLILSLVCNLSQQATQELKVERKPVSVPAGPGQRPFDVTLHLIPLDEIQSGGPPRDGIPALDHPASTSAAEANELLRPDDLVLGVATLGGARAYPVRVMNWHEVINDDVGHQPIVISWCPLCGSALVYDPHIGDKRHTFRVSGLLYKRNLLLYDLETDSLWSQLGGKAVTGPLAGTSLRLLPSTMATWAQWKEQHPETTVLSFQTGYRRDYSRDPYREWPLDRRLALVVSYPTAAKIYPFSALKKIGPTLRDEMAGKALTITFDAKNQTVTVCGPQGEQPPHFVVFFADARAFFPEAQIFNSK